jgi:hypothetical protein
MRDCTKIGAWKLADDLTVAIDRVFIHLSRRLGYLSDADAERLIGQTRQTFACLHGLIKAVERETGKFDKMAVASSRGQ